MLNEEEADDLLYCSRAGETQELQQMLSAVLARAGKQDGDADAFRQLMLNVAEKNEARNTLLHFAAANDHRGEKRSELTCYALLVAEHLLLQ